MARTCGDVARLTAAGWSRTRIPSHSRKPGPIATSTIGRDVERLPAPGDIWTSNSGVSVLVISSSVYNEIVSESTVVVVTVFDSEPGTGFGVQLDVVGSAGSGHQSAQDSTG